MRGCCCRDESCWVTRTATAAPAFPVSTRSLASLHCTEHLVSMLFMLLGASQENQHVFQRDYHGLVEVFQKDTVDHGLEAGLCVTTSGCGT